MDDEIIEWRLINERQSRSIDEKLVDYIIEKIKFNVKSANEYARRGNLYQAGMKSGTIIALIGCLNQVGIKADCECDTLFNGALNFKSIVVRGEKIFEC